MEVNEITSIKQKEATKENINKAQQRARRENIKEVQHARRVRTAKIE